MLWLIFIFIWTNLCLLSVNSCILRGFQIRRLGWKFLTENACIVKIHWFLQQRSLILICFLSNYTYFQTFSFARSEPQIQTNPGKSAHCLPDVGFKSHGTCAIRHLAVASLVLASWAVVRTSATGQSVGFLGWPLLGSRFRHVDFGCANEHLKHFSILFVCACNIQRCVCAWFLC